MTIAQTDPIAVATDPSHPEPERRSKAGVDIASTKTVAASVTANVL
ncbi:hypothetical protein [Kribbella sp. ALI-6-A]|nr:hypothetical protein [Kribbella sp. ALI-6-A]